MRIIAGQFRSRKLKSVPGLAVRPTPDRLRESLFSVIGSRVGGAVFIDAYAGSGAVGLEALSRGAKHVFLIERNAHALAVIRENLESLDAGGSVTVLRGPAANFLSNRPADIVFLDPPYDQLNEYTSSLVALSTARCPYAIAQHSSRLTLEESYGGLRKWRTLKQGDNLLSFYSYEPPGDLSI